jgi:hypothetical protein
MIYSAEQREQLHVCQIKVGKFLNLRIDLKLKNCEKNKIISLSCAE